MDFNATLKLYGKEYKFESFDEEPLTYILHFDKDTYIQRDIDCDDNHERMRLIHHYMSNMNGVEKRQQRIEQIYFGKEIEDIDFMEMLLENSLIWYIAEQPQRKRVPTEEEVLKSTNDMEILNETLILVGRAQKVGFRRKLVYLSKFLTALKNKNRELE